MSKNIIDKIWEAHVILQEKNHPVVFAVDYVLMHEVTSAQAFTVLREKGLKVFDPKKCFGTMDHVVPTCKNRDKVQDESAKKQMATMRKNMQDFDIPFADIGSGAQGVIHVVPPELGLIKPGMVVVCGDSHTATHGAFGALSFGIGTSEVSHVLATGCLLQKKPKTMKVEFKGKLQPGVYAKDVILKLIAEIGTDGATGSIIEYTGEVIRKMSMEERMTVCNMTIECGARSGLISPDIVTWSYLEKILGADVINQNKSNWEKWASDSQAEYDQLVKIDVSDLKPMVTWGTTPEQGVAVTDKIPAIKNLKDKNQKLAKEALVYTQLKEDTAILKTPIDWAFLGSCTNGRIEDLRVAAQILQGQKVHENVSFYVVPGSEKVMKQAIEEELDQIFKEAGADFRNPGCSLCLAMNDDKVPFGKRCISTSNRNFIGRQGTGSITHLASPATVAASAIRGEITNVQEFL